MNAKSCQRQKEHQPASSVQKMAIAITQNEPAMTSAGGVAHFPTSGERESDHQDRQQCRSAPARTRGKFV